MKKNKHKCLPVQLRSQPVHISHTSGSSPKLYSSTDKPVLYSKLYISYFAQNRFGRHLCPARHACYLQTITDRYLQLVRQANLELEMECNYELCTSSVQWPQASLSITPLYTQCQAATRQLFFCLSQAAHSDHQYLLRNSKFYMLLKNQEGSCLSINICSNNNLCYFLNLYCHNLS